MRKLFQNLIVIFVISTAVASCQYKFMVEPIPPPPPPGDTTSFSLEVVPIWAEVGCTSCHSAGATAPDLTSPDVYNILFDMGLVVANDPAGSKIYYYPLPDGSHYKKYSSAQALQIQYWIEEGAKNN